MKFSVNREALLRPLTIVASAVERRQTMPILSNLLIKVNGKKEAVSIYTLIGDNLLRKSSEFKNLAEQNRDLLENYFN